MVFVQPIFVMSQYLNYEYYESRNTINSSAIKSAHKMLINLIPDSINTKRQPSHQCLFALLGFHQHFTCTFLYESIFFRQNVTREKNFRTKNARVKCWWNWHREWRRCSIKDFIKSSFGSGVSAKSILQEGVKVCWTSSFNSKIFKI